MSKSVLYPSLQQYLYVQIQAYEPRCHFPELWAWYNFEQLLTVDDWSDMMSGVPHIFYGHLTGVRGVIFRHLCSETGQKTNLRTVTYATRRQALADVFRTILRYGTVRCVRAYRELTGRV